MADHHTHQLPVDEHGHHVYLSTACLHGRDEHRDEIEREWLHGRCATDARRYDGSHKVAATCKYCQSPCLCDCHQPETSVAS